jgi:hypothetical protein
MHSVITGRVQPTLEAGQQDPERALARLAKRVSTWGAITEKLLADGITAFIPFFGRAASLLEGETQRAALVEGKINAT